MTYEEAQAYVAGLAPRGWRLGLERMSEFDRRAKLVDPEINFVHIAGTNGKGSVTAYVQSILVEAGLPTGAFFSPYVYEPRERVQVGRRLISKEDFARIATQLRPIEESLSDTDFGGVTEFEMKTAIGFRHWAETRCQWVALEVGLGGRLDSTNIIDPGVSIIVSIGLDHTAILGDTLGGIAAEKAGIIKPGKPVIVGSLPDAAWRVVHAIAEERGSPIWQMGRDICVETDLADSYRVVTPERTVGELRPGLVGAAQPENMALAAAALVAAGVDIDDKTFRKGSLLASAPGRFEIRELEGRLIILDGAHNGEAAEQLAATLAVRFPTETFCILTGMVGGHDPERFFRPLARFAGGVYVAPIDNPRAFDPADLAEIYTKLGLMSRPCDSVEEALELCLQSNLPILVTGSFYLVGEVGNALDKMAPKTD